ncbi:MAG: hypothetical protein GY829_14550 [Gammaproteobacteria bacterium]|nr:hypothetical protein [Gammaproteobacteria bacterium]
MEMAIPKASGLGIEVLSTISVMPDGAVQPLVAIVIDHEFNVAMPLVLAERKLIAANEDSQIINNEINKSQKTSK